MEPGVKEIQNLKNTCYINSVVQLLAYVEPLRFYMSYQKLESEKLANCGYSLLSLTKEFQEVINKIWDRDMKRIQPKNFVHKCFALSPYFQPFTQQDSQELLMLLLDKLDCELKELFPEKGSIVNRIFQGSYITHIRCNGCNLASNKAESFLQLNLPIPEGLRPIENYDAMMSRDEIRMIIEAQHGVFVDLFSIFKKEKAQLNLYYCLESFCQEQQTDYYCAKCETVCGHRMNLELVSMPNYLLMSLKRFRYNYWSSKISERVYLPKVLNLRNGNNASEVYMLAAVIEHSGFLFKGHYKIYVNKAGHWWILNDKSVKRCEWEDVFKAQAYMFMYVKKEIWDNNMHYFGQDEFVARFNEMNHLSNAEEEKRDLIDS
jgi:ubiquitin C-terminal hydrolase